MVSIPPLIVFLLYAVKEGWNDFPQADGLVTLMPIQVFASIVLMYSSIEQKWFDGPRTAKIIIMGVAFVVGLSLYYQTFLNIVALGDYGSALVTFLLLTCFPILSGWIQNYFKR